MRYNNALFKIGVFRLRDFRIDSREGICGISRYTMGWGGGKYKHSNQTKQGMSNIGNVASNSTALVTSASFEADLRISSEKKLKALPLCILNCS